jgi:acetyl-CoA carboxylase carboxyl transferase subunit alpha
MLQYSVYSVISPEGCASILWKSAEKASEAAEAMAMNADRLYKLKLIDAVIQEPLGGAHTDFDEMANQLKIELVKQLAQIQYFSLEKLLELRYNKILAIGV